MLLDSYSQNVWEIRQNTEINEDDGISFLTFLTLMDLETEAIYSIVMFVFSVKLYLIFINGQSKITVSDNDLEGTLHKISLGFFVNLLL